VNQDPVVMAKIKIVRSMANESIGHALGLQESLLKKYHRSWPKYRPRCFTYEEALGKIKLGMKNRHSEEAQLPKTL